MQRILIIEDDATIMRGLKDALTAEHFEPVTCSDGTEGLRTAQKRSFDAIILDVMLPGMNGFDVCRTLREGKNTTPILMLTGKGEEVDKVLGLELGADDYLTKPFGVRELIARVKALLRRRNAGAQDIQECTFGDVYIDFKKQEARKGKKTLRMTAKEFELLKYFVLHEGEVVSRAKLLDDVWGYEETPTTRTVDTFILNLRKKIETKPADPKHLLTVHTVGYKFVV
ncbi:MAG: DNA-binding response regulator [Ignavibacteria bacterium GWA2_55_11]|nr:MAG: DNA-binding response regulator [Ignavibacteria bacterium GWA2_55_11]OGU45314.1 MAG: DNA-binding response regulator [Ignavibacteria bacterium GWC2_56_12]OGU64738.1 MAG: DNA-binding response regulator [Ignavibacteria bacterium RIFCSPHIGHO2_02_FULL_56_12]OGU73589.1 MAG: DNA-binding response regulator [Ignavibacteria bacterium RIFCSPLOWO2_12_FULL_56_21]OGU74108.1 MAG: DNA-binding response regulator [Ignavibacteria bacterium RIFCSPLOWO2_02_FULL_55_14]